MHLAGTASPSLALTGAPPRLQRRGVASRGRHGRSRGSVCRGGGKKAGGGGGRASFCDGTDFAPIVIGTWALAGGHGKLKRADVIDAMQAYADEGLNTFDTADIYKTAESTLGAFLAQREKSGSAGEVKVFTKLVPTIFGGVPNAKAVQRACDKSRKNLKVESLDLVQLHWPFKYGDCSALVDTGLHLADQQAAGAIKAIGVTNVNTHGLAALLDAGVPVVSNQVQLSLLDRRPLNGMSDLCKARDVTILAYGPLAGGLLTGRYLGDPAPSLGTSSLKKYGALLDGFGAGAWQDLLAALEAVAEKHGVSGACVALRWVMDQGPNVVPVVGFRGKEHVADTASALALRLDSKDRAAIAEALARAGPSEGDIYSFERTSDD